MKTPKGKEVFVFDNEGKTADRFTIVNKEDAFVYGASENPFHPLGFGQFSHELEPRTLNEFSYENVSEYVGEAQTNPDWLGKEITEFSELPEDVQKYVEQISE